MLAQRPGVTFRRAGDQPEGTPGSATLRGRMKHPCLFWMATAALLSCAHHRPSPLLQPKTPQTLRAMTFNIQSALRGLEGIADVINAVEPDIVALQEVDRHTSRANRLDQAAELSKLTGLVHHRHFNATRYHGGDYGVALLSRFPIRSVELTALPNQELSEPRVVGRAVLDVDGVLTSVYVTHLAHLPIRELLRIAQAQKIFEVMAEDPNPKLLLGDLNDQPGSLLLFLFEQKLTNLFRASGVGEPGTFPLPLVGNLTLDYAFGCDQVEPLHSVVIPTDASDHYPLVADVKLRPAATARAQVQ